MKRPNGSQRTYVSDDDRACPPSASALSIPSAAAAAAVGSSPAVAAASPRPSRRTLGRRRSAVLAAVATVAVVLGSSLPALAFVGPQQPQNYLAPSSAAARRAGGSGSGLSGASALQAASIAPPTSGRRTANDDDDDDDDERLQEDEATAAARTLLASRTEEVATLRAAQAEQLLRIAALATDLANVHGDTDKLGTDLVKGQAELSRGLRKVTKLVSEVNGATGALTEVEVQRMEAMTALEALVGSAALEEIAPEEVLEIDEEEVVVTSAPAVAVQVST